MWSLAFWKAAAERAIKSAAQGVLWTWVVGDKIASLMTFDWQAAAYGAGGMALFSLLTSIVSVPASGTNGPSLFGTEKLPAEPPTAG